MGLHVQSDLDTPVHLAEGAHPHYGSSVRKEDLIVTLNIWLMEVRFDSHFSVAVMILVDEEVEVNADDIRAVVTLLEEESEHDEAAISLCRLVYPRMRLDVKC